jgi:hypothetical protein
VVIQLFSQAVGPIVVTVNGVNSVSSIPIAANSSITTKEDPMTSIDIGPVTVTGTTFYTDPGAYVVNASGSDIWNTQDAFRFVYTTRTNNFDIIVQVPSVLPADQWSKAGLMAREMIDGPNSSVDGGARFVDVVTTASASQVTLDAGTGENSLSMDARDTENTNAYEPPNFDASIASGGGSGDDLPPTYPNQWLRLTRTVSTSSAGAITSDNFETLYSSDGSHWTHMGYWSPITNNNENPGTPLAPFPSVTYVGLCSTAHVTTDFLITATYQNFADYVPAALGPTLTASVVAGKLNISWTPTGGTLESSPVLGPGAVWTTVGTANPASITIGKGDLFFQVVSP